MKKIPTPTRTPARICCGCRRDWSNWREKIASANPRIAVVAADAWPLPWYLRKFSQVGYWQPEQETGDADFFITTTDVSGKLAERLKNFRPEFFGVRPNVLIILWTLRSRPMKPEATQAMKIPGSGSLCVCHE